LIETTAANSITSVMFFTECIVLFVFLHQYARESRYHLKSEQSQNVTGAVFNAWTIYQTVYHLLLQKKWLADAHNINFLQ